MKLWKLLFRHYSQKDSKKGIVCYLLADSSEQIYDFIRTEPNIPNGTEYGESICVSWEYYDDPEDCSYDETHRSRLIECCGEMYDEYEDVSDTYYGVTHYGWKCVCEDISTEQVDILKNVGVVVVDVNMKQ